MSSLFRKKSMENIASPEQLNQYISVTHISSWALLGAILILVAGVLVWAFTGNITVSIKGNGIVFPQMGSSNVVAKSDGFITDVRVTAGEYISVGDVVAVMPQENILNKIKIGKASGQDVTELQKEYLQKSMILSEYNGRITNVISSDRLIEIGDTVANIILQDENYNDKEIVCYISASDAQRLQIGMEAEVSPDFAPREEYGYMLGYISKVGTYPVTISDVKEHLGNFAMSEELLPSTNFTEVRITLISDPNSRNAIKWSNPKGMDLSVDIGNTCEILIIAEKNKPIQLLF